MTKRASSDDIAEVEQLTEAVLKKIREGQSKSEEGSRGRQATKLLTRIAGVTCIALFVAGYALYQTGHRSTGITLLTLGIILWVAMALLRYATPRA